MDFDDLPDDAAYRAKARAWLASHAERNNGPRGRLGIPVDDRRLTEAKEWQATKAAAGYASITLPREYGGGGGTTIQQVIYRQEEADFRVPDGVYEIGLGHCIPTILAWGNDQQRDRLIRPAISGREVWCQLFSEPNAGSDLAAVRCRADRDGDDWIINGQKVWSSGAHFCDFGLLLARSDFQSPKHRGLTMFYVDMRAAGVACRPIRQMSGASEFNEVFLTDVRVSDANRVGPVGEGWPVAMTTLNHERGAVSEGLGLLDHAALLAIAAGATIDGEPAADDPRVMERIAELYIISRGVKLTSYRGMTALSRGEAPGPEQSIGKLLSAIAAQQASYLAMELMGPSGVLTSESLGEEWRMVERSWMWGAAMRIAGGTEEILRNMIAERVLGLPPDQRIDKDIPFNQLVG
jgi:alkylation response protein AidB-like acyl-CoA dehydrogenase